MMCRAVRHWLLSSNELLNGWGLCAFPDGNVAVMVAWGWAMCNTTVLLGLNIKHNVLNWVLGDDVE